MKNKFGFFQLSRFRLEEEDFLSKSSQLSPCTTVRAGRKGVRVGILESQHQCEEGGGGENGGALSLRIF